MKTEDEQYLGLRHKETGRLEAVYPKPVKQSEKSEEKTQRMVRDWFYEQNCSAEEMLRHVYVDALTDEEEREYGIAEE